MNWIRPSIVILSFITFVSKADVVRVKYKIRKVESLSQVYKKFVDNDNVIHADLDFVQMTMEVNDGIKNWSELEKGTTISLFIEEDYMKEEVYDRFDKERKTPYSAKLARSIASREKLSFQKKLDAFQGKTSYSLFYMASSGTYSQNIDQETEVGLDINQDSPISFGAMVSHKFAPVWSFSGSFYYSKFDNAVVAGKITEIPNEYGASSYLYYSGLKGVGLYSGVDYEQLSSFSLQNLIQNSSLSYDSHKFGFLTGGVDFFKTWEGKLFLIKFAMSYSVFSNTTSEYTDSGKDFSGLRYLAYLNMPLSKSVFLHGLVKYHDLSDTERMNIMRIGFGGGIRF